MGNTMSKASARARRGPAPGLALLSLGLLLVWPVAAYAQQDPQQDGELEGINGKEYNVKQSIELGERWTSITGNTNVYDTFVNLQQGPRLLGFTTEMQSLDNHGGLFDRLYVNAFGYGGDPNDVSRVRIAKNKWYNFDAMIRRDQNAWDYSLDANPLNPTTGFANGPAGYGPLATSTCTACVLTTSPHLLDTRRYLSDYKLLLFPESKIRVRLGYSRNINNGPELSSLHLGTEQSLLQSVRTTLNTYRLGVDYRIAPRTNISYDELWNDYKGDTGATDQNQNPLFLLSNGTAVDLGYSFNSTANQPCGGTFLATGFVNPTCSALINYLTHGRVRTATPTEQLSFQSGYWRNIDITGRFSYTAGDADEFNYLQSLFGREARTNMSNELVNGTASGERVAATGDLGFTWNITNAWRFLDSFHYSNFHNPMQFSSDACAFFAPGLTTAANVFTPAGTLPIPCLAPAGSATGTPVHTTSSEPDLALDLSGGFLKQEQVTNLAEVDYQVSWRFGARAGFRYRHRDIDDSSFADNEEFYFPSNANRGDCALVMGALPAGCTSIGNGAFEFVTPVVTVSPFSTTINEYSGLFGVWAKPVRSWRISFDTELMSADNVFTRISPRQSQEYRVRSVWKPLNWFSLNGSVRDWEGRDNVYQIDNLQHDRAYDLTAIFQPNEKFALELSYGYNDVFSQILVCYPGTPAPSGINKCVNVAGLIEQLSTYKELSSNGGLDLMWTPIRHLTTKLGGSFTGTSGSALFLNPNQEPGPLNSKWLSPNALVAYSFNKNWTGKAYWNYYGYHEDFTDVPQDIYAPRNFHANLLVLSARYAF